MWLSGTLKLVQGKILFPDRALYTEVILEFVMGKEEEAMCSLGGFFAVSY